MSYRSILLATTMCIVIGSAVTVEQALAHGGGGGGGGGGGVHSSGGDFHSLSISRGTTEATPHRESGAHNRAGAARVTKVESPTKITASGPHHKAGNGVGPVPNPILIRQLGNLNATTIPPVAFPQAPGKAPSSGAVSGPFGVSIPVLHLPPVPAGTIPRLAGDQGNVQASVQLPPVPAGTIPHLPGNQGNVQATVQLPPVPAGTIPRLPGGQPTAGQIQSKFLPGLEVLCNPTCPGAPTEPGVDPKRKPMANDGTAPGLVSNVIESTPPLEAGCYWTRRKFVTPDGEVVRLYKICEIVDPDQQ
jgi:hypothetical protein